MDQPVDFQQSPHISPACLPDPQTDYSGNRCWTTGWGKDAFGDYGKYQNILKVSSVCLSRLAYSKQHQFMLMETFKGDPKAVIK